MCQGSSVVEQGTHKPLVGSSTLPPGTIFQFDEHQASRHDSLDGCPLTLILSPEGERKLPSPLSYKGEDQVRVFPTDVERPKSLPRFTWLSGLVGRSILP